MKAELKRIIKKHKGKVVPVSFLFLFVFSYVYASTSYGFKTEEDLSPGELVSIDSQNAEFVVAAHSDNVANLIGVVAEDQGALLEISQEDADVLIVTEGIAAVLVSDLGGDIQAGDRITASPLKGIGMKARSSARILGFAREAYSGESEDSETIVVNQENGDTEEVNVGKILIFVQVHEFEGRAGSIFGPFEAFAETVAGGPVSIARLSFAFAAVFFALLIAAILLWGSISSSIGSIGRNPLARRAILASILQVTVVSLIILGIGAAAAYFILQV